MTILEEAGGHLTSFLVMIQVSFFLINYKLHEYTVHMEYSKYLTGQNLKLPNFVGVKLLAYSIFRFLKFPFSFLPCRHKKKDNESRHDNIKSELDCPSQNP